MNNIKPITLTGALLALAQGLKTRETHMKSSDQDSPLGVIFFLFLCIGGIVYLVMRCSRRRSVPPPPPPLPQPPVYYPNRQPIPLYRNWQNGSSPSHPLPPSTNSNNPYISYPPPVNTNNPSISYPPPTGEDDITRAVNHRNSGEFWSEPDFLAERKLRNPCNYCNGIGRFGQEPRLMVDCSVRHVFHLGCLNQFRVNQKMGRSMECPCCRQLVSRQQIKLFCVKCKRRSIELDLVKFSTNEGVIDGAAVAMQYGQVCHECKNR